MLHKLEIFEGYFRAVLDGRKTWEILEDKDRGIQVGDQLLLEEVKGTTRVKTGLVIRVDVCYLYSGPGLERNHVIAGIINRQTIVKNRGYVGV